MILREDYTEEIQDEMIDAFDDGDITVVEESEQEEKVDHGT